MRHDWYLRPQLVVLSLADDEVDNEEKAKILEALLDYNVPTEFEKGLVPLHNHHPVSFRTEIHQLVNDQSYFLFTNTALKFSKSDLVDMLTSFKNGTEATNSHLRDFQDYVKHLQVNKLMHLITKYNEK